MIRVQIEAGVCGFVTTVTARCADGQHVSLTVKSSCADVRRVADELNAKEFDAFQEIGPSRGGSVFDTSIMRICSALPHAACPVPAGVCKAVEAAAGLALPKDAHIRIEKLDDA